MKKLLIAMIGIAGMSFALDSFANVYIDNGGFDGSNTYVIKNAVADNRPVGNIVINPQSLKVIKYNNLQFNSVHVSGHNLRTGEKYDFEYTFSSPQSLTNPGANVGKFIVRGISSSKNPSIVIFYHGNALAKIAS